MTEDVDLHGAAALLNRSYDWLQRRWRTLPGFPPPFTGAEPRGRPQWRRVDVLSYKAGRRWSPGPGPAAGVDAPPKPPAAVAPPASPANDTHPHPPSDRVQALLAFGGR